MKKHVSILVIARALGLTIRRGKAKCWRAENHRHGDVDPSLSFFEKRNRCRCFVCDMKGGHSNVDLVMGVLNCDLGSAVLWVAERFSVPNVKVGRPAGKALASAVPYRVGVHGLRSGLWGAMTAAERSILVVLDYFRDSETGLTRLSYRAIMRYSGVAKTANVSNAIKELARMHALQILRGARIGVTRECSTYRVTLTDPKFLEICNEVYTSARNEIAQERDYRASQKRDRERAARKPTRPSLRVITQNTNTAGGLRPPDPPDISFSDSNQRQKATPTCEGQDLSSPGEVHAGLPLPPGQREICVSGQRSIEEQKQILRKRGLL
jgi:hypothetical protein